MWFSTSAGVPLPAGVKLPPRTRNLAIEYTASSLAVPERVRFRYKLDGSARRLKAPDLFTTPQSGRPHRSAPSTPPATCGSARP